MKTKTKTKNLKQSRKFKNSVEDEKRCNATGIKDLNSVGCKYYCSDECKMYY